MEQDGCYERLRTRKRFLINHSPKHKSPRIHMDQRMHNVTAYSRTVFREKSKVFRGGFREAPRIECAVLYYYNCTRGLLFVYGKKQRG